jgi:hypothetical protein
VVAQVPAWEPGMREPLEGVCVWTVPCNIVITVTLFRDNRTHAYENKDWAFVVEDVRSLLSEVEEGCGWNWLIMYNWINNELD